MSQLIVESDPPPAYGDVADRGKKILLYVTTAPSLWVPLTTVEITSGAKPEHKYHTPASYFLHYVTRAGP